MNGIWICKVGKGKLVKVIVFRMGFVSIVYCIGLK